MMRFALSAPAALASDLSRIVMHAKEWGYDGVELSAHAGDPDNANGLKQLFADVGIAPACMASAAAFTGRSSEDNRAIDALRRDVDAAAGVGCCTVRLADPIVQKGQSKAVVGSAFGDWLLRAADYAAEQRVTIAIQNSGSFCRASDLWAVLDRLNHPSVGCCWSLLSAAAVEESPHVSVPMLNSRIQYALVSDAKTSPAGLMLTKLGEGDVAVKAFVHRLRGIGYSGFVAVAGPGQVIQITDHSAYFAEAIKMLRAWQKEGADLAGVESNSEPAAASKKPAAAKPAARLQ